MYLPEDNTLPFEAGNVAPSLHGPPPKFNEDLQGDAEEKKKKCISYIDIDLLKSKSFYFLFYGAYGSLYPLLAVYFKQLGLNASQSGLLIGIRPFIEFCAAPLWGGLADSWRKAKVLFLFSLFAWLLFTEAMAFIRPAGSKCIIFNRTDDDGHEIIVVDQIVHDGDEHHFVYGPKDHEEDDGTVVGHQSDIDQPFHTDEIHPEIEIPSGSNYKLFNKSIGTEEPVRRLPVGTSSVKFISDDVRGVFLLLLIIIVVGEFFSSPTITLADSATLGYLGSDRLEYYGQQRMFGSLGWGIFMLIEGILLDHTATHTHGCGGALDEVQEVKRNYYICFGTYAVLITCSFFVATQFKFKYYSEDDHKTEMTKLTYNKQQDQISIGGENRTGTYGSVATQEGANPTSSTADGGQATSDETTETTDSLQDRPAPLEHGGPECNRGVLSSAEAQSEDPAGIRQVFRMYATIRYGSVLCVAWFAGFGMGLLFTFLYWHLQDLGGPPSLFGLASVVNHVSEILAYFFSHKILQAIGHIPVFCLGLFCYAIRFLAISVLINPWWVLIVETLQGLTHALIWAACTSYIGLATSQRLRSSAQGILQGTHHGLGRGCGAIFGGLLVNAFGTEQTFRGFGVASLVVLVIFLAMQYPSYNSKSDPSSSADPATSSRARSKSSTRDEIQPVLTAEDVTPIPYSEKRDENINDDEDRDLERGEGSNESRVPSQGDSQGATGRDEF